MVTYLEQFIIYISQPWTWWVGGLMVAFTLFILLFFGKEFGMSANLRVMCAADGAGEYNDFFDFDWKSQGWNLMVALGAMFGGYIAATYLTPDGQAVSHISAQTIESLKEIGLNYEVGSVPLILDEVFNWRSLFTLRGFIVIVIGGILVGFGARYAGGCTSGHAISGISNMQLPSLIAVIGFFIGGLIMVHFILPFVMQL